MILSLALLAWTQQPDGPRIQIEGLDGETRELSATTLPWTDPREQGAWILRPEGFPGARGEREPDVPDVRVTLVNGDELMARVVGGAGEKLELELVGGVTVPFEVSDLASLRFPDNIPLDQRLALVPAPEGDRLYRRTAALDALDGTLEGFARDGVLFESVIGARTIPWDEVGALFIERLGAAPERERADQVPIVVGFAGPSAGRVRGHLLRLERESCRLLLGGKTEVSLPLHAVAEIVVADGRLTFVSELEPAGETGRGVPFGDELGMSWPHHMDRSVLGTELRCGGRTFRHGIGMHAPSTLTFVLDGGYRTLRGRVGIDDSTRVNPPAARGSVVFRVRADGMPLFESPVLRGGDPYLVLPPLDLGGKRELVLEVDPSGDFAGDRANWLDLVLVR